MKEESIEVVRQWEVSMKHYNHVAISSRIRLARNISGINFTNKLSDFESDRLIRIVRNVFEYDCGLDYSPLADMSISRCNALLERHVISKELIANRDISSIFTNEEESIIIMVGEEDHIREQSICKGFDLEGAYEQLRPIDDILLKSADVCYNSDYGFLTSSPANLGTAMRASVMVFIPALDRSGEIEYFFKMAKDSGLTFRGIYGEGTYGEGSLYQISNQGSLGYTEKEIIDKVSEFFLDVCDREERLRNDLFENHYVELRDEIQRAYGVLINSYSLEENEMRTLLSKLKLGRMFGFVKIKDENQFMKLYYHGAGANLKEITKFENNKEENVIRSEYISKRIKNLVLLGGV